MTVRASAPSYSNNNYIVRIRGTMFQPRKIQVWCWLPDEGDVGEQRAEVGGSKMIWDIYWGITTVRKLYEYNRVIKPFVM